MNVSDGRRRIRIWESPAVAVWEKEGGGRKKIRRREFDLPPPVLSLR